MEQAHQSLSQECCREDPCWVSTQWRAVRKVGSGLGINEPHSAKRIHRYTGGAAG